MLCLIMSLSVILCACADDNDGDESKTGDASSAEESKADIEPGETYEYNGSSIVLPKGFTVNENSLLATPEDYPVHADNIVLSFEKRSKVADIKEDELLALIKESDDSIFKTLEKFDEFKNTTIDGHDALIVKYSFVYSEIEMHATQCAVEVSGGIVSYTFTSVTGEYDAAFEQSLGSIKVTE